jgi:hypothetical protein
MVLRFQLAALCIALLAAVAPADEPPLDNRVPPEVVDQEPAATISNGLRAIEHRTYGKLSLDPSWRESKENSVSAILIPGLFADEDSMSRIRAALKKNGIPTAKFHYADYLPINQVASVLAEELAKLHRSEPQRSICLVTHSLGGLVARCALESDGRPAVGVKRLIMIAPPNHGSALATFSASEISKYIESLGGAKVDLSAINEAIDHFVGDARESLEPGSELLTKLNEQPRTPGVKYTIIAGTGGPIPRELIELPLLITDLLIGADPQVEKAVAPARRIAETDEWIDGKGDGVVSVQSARLAGVTDWLTFPFRHRDFGSISLSAEREQAVRQVTQVVCERLSTLDEP